MTDTYRERCHFEDCGARFLGISRSEYVDHLREAHGESIADLWDRLVVSRDGGNICYSDTETDRSANTENQTEKP